MDPCPPHPSPLPPAFSPARAPPHICSHVSSPQARAHAHGGHARRNRQLHPVLPPCSTTAITNPKRHPTCLRSRPTTRLCLTPIHAPSSTSSIASARRWCGSTWRGGGGPPPPRTAPAPA